MNETQTSAPTITSRNVSSASLKQRFSSVIALIQTGFSSWPTFQLRNVELQKQRQHCIIRSAVTMYVVTSLPLWSARGRQLQHSFRTRQ